VLDHDTPKAIPVKAGISDGQFVEISGDGITEGMAILTGVENAKKPQNGSASPLGGPGMPHH
jgi:HlyD family secretion protein